MFTRSVYCIDDLKIIIKYLFNKKNIYNITKEILIEGRYKEMKHELTIYELGEALKKIDNKYELAVLIKKDLSGGWMTITGTAKMEVLPCIGGGCNGKSINILEIRVNCDDKGGSLIKLTGAKTKKFNIDVASTRYKEISTNSITLNQIKVNEDECKLRIDEDIIFTIKERAEVISNIINSVL